MANLIPMQAIPAQNILTTLDDGQSVMLKVYTRRYGMFIDITINGVLEIGAVICENLNRIIRNQYLNDAVGFAGDFVFYDTQGNTSPVYTGLGTRYQLIYLTAAELAALGLAG
jgi:hypothetical protein